MKKTQQILATIISLIILSVFAGTSWADVCVGDYTIDDTDTSGDIAALSSCTEVTGDLIIYNTSLTSVPLLPNLTSVGRSLKIMGIILPAIPFPASITIFNGLRLVAKLRICFL